MAEVAFTDSASSVETLGWANILVEIIEEKNQLRVMRCRLFIVLRLLSRLYKNYRAGGRLAFEKVQNDFLKSKLFLANQKENVYIDAVQYPL